MVTPFAVLVFFWLRRDIRHFRLHPPLSFLEQAGAWSYSLYLLMLRRASAQEVAGLECLQLADSGLQGRSVEPLLQREVAALRRELQGLQLDEGAQGHEEVVGLRPLGARGRADQEAFCFSDLCYSSTCHRSW